MGSEFLEEKGTTARLVAVESTTDHSQLEEQTERASAVLRKEYVRHVVSTGEVSRLKLLGAVQSRVGLHRCSAMGYRPLTPRGVAPQGCGQVYPAISGFAEGRQVLYAGVAGLLAWLLKLKLMPLIWWKIGRTVQRYTRIFELEKYKFLLTFRVSFGHPFHADLVSLGRTYSRSTPSTGR